MKSLNSYLWGGLLAVFLASCGTDAVQKDYADYVNPFIGTGGHGHTFPGAVVPNGMIQPGPDTRIYGWDACSGYYDADTIINGFSHLHLSGTGCGDYGEILLMPTVGEQHTVSSFEASAEDASFAATGGSPAQTLPYASRFSHKNEVASPGYYSVYLDTYGVKAELTATKRVALHRYTFPESSEAGFILDLDYSLQGQRHRALSLEVVNDSTLRGYKNTNSWAWRHDVYFESIFSKPFTCEVLTDSISQGKGKHALPVKKALLHFATAKDEQVLVKVALSSVDAEGASKNLAEIPGWNFEQVKAEARRDWNDYLGKIDIETGNEEQRTVFYTALYHTGIAPSLFTDIDGRYRGVDREIHTAEADKPMYTIFSLWDTFRALHPLYTIIDPEQNTQFINALLKQYQEGGVLPMWELAGNYTGTMIGYHAVPVIVDAYMKGDRGFDAQLALKACLRSAEYDTLAPIATTDYLKHAALMPISKYYKNTLGYVPCDKEHEAVAKGLEYAYNDWCISQLAGALEDTATQSRYAEFGKSYRHYFDPSVRFMRGKDINGKWRTPFNPRSSNHREDDYCEGTAWQWTWFVPQDVDGLVELMGGREGFIGKLDSLFTADSALEGDQTSADISGLIGQYAHGNEPSHHILHLYNRVGQPWKTQELVDNVLHNQYFNDPNGLSGNEDCGQMSAWYVFSAMGFYPVNPVGGCYEIGTPLYPETRLHLSGGKTFTVKAPAVSKENRYIHAVRLDGKPYGKSYITHEQIMAGSVLELEMGNEPGKAWYVPGK